mgnify:CR=1 FL=1
MKLFQEGLKRKKIRRRNRNRGNKCKSGRRGRKCRTRRRNRNKKKKKKIVLCNLGKPDNKTKPKNNNCVFNDENLPYNEERPTIVGAYYETDTYTDGSVTSFQTIDYKGIKRKNIFDRRGFTNPVSGEKFLTNTRQLVIRKIVSVYVFLITFGKTSKKTVEVLINVIDYSKPDNALVVAEKYGIMFGRVPGFLLCNLKEIHINKGVLHWAAHPTLNSIIIHSDYDYEEEYNIYDVIIHELTHATMDNIHAKTSGWKAAIKDDCKFFNIYSEINTDSEDLAVIMPKYIAYARALIKDDNVSENLKLISQKFANRFKYLSNLKLKMNILE